MNTTTELTGSHLRTYNAIFQHPVSHNLGWHDVHSLFRHLGTVDVESNGNLKVTRNGHTLVLHAARTKDVSGTEEVMSLRHFIERSETTAAEPAAKEAHWLLVIDHHEARIFRSELHGAVPERILPHEPAEHFRHAYGSKDFNKGKDRPNSESFFEPVTKALQGAGQILILGTGTGMSSEMDQFVGWTKKHHPELAKRILGTVAVDEHHLTESQLLAKAREFYASLGKPKV
ncbi:MAG TPA: hypothetical protein VMF06_09930 [Candidatus Limnocylindria bacterium]|nr:hypothetical protein [Candidatus Limnocylindria bacterium]